MDQRMIRTCTISSGAQARLLALHAVLASLLLPAPAQTPSWSSQFGTSMIDGATVVGPDGAGGAFVAGITYGTLGGPSLGKIDAFLRRVDGTGAQLWMRQFGTAQDESARGLALDGAGGVFVCGTTTTIPGGISPITHEVWLRRFDASGASLWSIQAGTGLNDSAYACAADAAGGVYVVGITDADPDPFSDQIEVWLGRYDAAGALLWLRELGTSSYEDATIALPDGTGGLIVGGTTGGSLGGPSAGAEDAWLARFDSSGNQLWIRQFGSAANDELSAAARGTGDAVFVGGWTAGVLGGSSSGFADAWFARYGTDGSASWTQQLGTSTWDAVYAIASDGAGGLFLGGNTDGALAGPNSGFLDAWIAHHDATGSPIWISQFGTAGNDFLTGLANNGLGGAFVSGSTPGDLFAASAGASDAWLSRFDEPCSPASSYCSASATSIAGCAAAMQGLGSPSVSSPTGFTIASGAVPGANIGILISSANGAASTPFGTLGGMICVASPLFRSPPKLSGGQSGQCNGTYVFTLADVMATSPIVTAGATIHTQAWARDPANADGFLLSDGLTFTVCP